MVRWSWLLLLVGCRQVFGIDDPHARGIDAQPMAADADIDATIDAAIVQDAADCSMQPAAPPFQLDESQNAGATTLRIKNLKVGTTGGKYIVAAAGDAFDVAFNYTWVYSSCASNCIDQIEIGYVPGDRVGCPFDGPVARAVAVSGMLTYPMTAPATPGWTSIRIAIGQALGCTANSAHTWFEGPPPDTEIAGYVCVH